MKIALSVVLTSATAVICTGVLSAPAQAMDEHQVISPQENARKPGPASIPPGAEAAVLYGDPTKEGLFALRLKLEPELAAIGSTQADEAEQAAARAALSSLERAQGRDRGGANRAFHLALVRPAGRPVTFDIVERLHVLADRYVRKHLEPQGRDARADAEHRALLDAWLARDGGAVAALLTDHVARTLDDLERQLKAE